MVEYKFIHNTMGGKKIMKNQGKLFVFGIGGTGSRVIKSLTMLLGAGVEINASSIVPIILDPHQSNQDLKRTTDLLKDYQKIREDLEPEPHGFFKTEIQTLRNLVFERTKEKDGENKLSETFSFKLSGVSNQIFQDYIGFKELGKNIAGEEKMPEGNRALCRMLFSEKSLKTKMDIGFVGNPNIGSVVLNQFKYSDEFKYFASNYENNDRIFIVSSIFGGTGAAGFPIILKNIREASNNINLTHKGFLTNSKIGAITVMPYFGVNNNGNSLISKSTFISKTKAALSYYADNITGNNSINALYYIGDEMTHDYKNDPGEGGQQNDAHFVELAAALSIIDFMEIDDKLLETEDGKALTPIYKEFGIRKEQKCLTFNDLSPETLDLIQRRLSQYQLMKMYIAHALGDAIKEQPWCNRSNPVINSTFLTDVFYKTYLKEFNSMFNDWLIELGRNTRGFKPFDINVESNNLFGFIGGIESKKDKILSKKNYDLYNACLNGIEQEKQYQSSKKKFMSIFYDATNKI